MYNKGNDFYLGIYSKNSKNTGETIIKAVSNMLDCGCYKMSRELKKIPDSAIYFTTELIGSGINLNMHSSKFANIQCDVRVCS